LDAVGVVGAVSVDLSRTLVEAVRIVGSDPELGRDYDSFEEPLGPLGFREPVDQRPELGSVAGLP